MVTTPTQRPNSVNVTHLICSNLVFHSARGDYYSEYNIGLGNAEESKLGIQKTYQV